MKFVMKVLDFIEEKVALVVFVVMLAITFVNVIGRYVFHASISFTDEVTTNLFVLVSVLGTGIAAKNRAHLGLSAFTELFPKRTQVLISAVANVLGAFFGGVLLVSGVGMVQNQIKLETVTAMLQWPAWVFGIFLPIGAVFITIRFLQVAVEDVKEFLAWNKGGEDK